MTTDPVLIGAWLSVIVSAALGTWAVWLTVLARKEMAAAEERALARYAEMMGAISAIAEQALGDPETDPEQARDVFINEIVAKLVDKLAESQRMSAVGKGVSPITGMPAWLTPFMPQPGASPASAPAQHQSNPTGF